MMERLTQRDEYGNADIIALSDMMPEIYAGLSFSETNALTDALNRLANYEDLEEEGRLLVLPCKVGETIYYLNPFDEIEKGRITMIQQKANGTLKFRVTTTFSHDVTSDAFGKSVFRTGEEAEAKLKGRENDE